MGRQLERQLMIRAGQRTHHLHRLLGDLAQVQPITFQRQPSILQSRRIEHLRHQQVHLDGLCFQHLQRPNPRLFELTEHTLLQHREIAVDHTQGTAELVRGQVEELALRFLESGQALGDAGPVERGRDIRGVTAQPRNLVSTEEGRIRARDQHHGPHPGVEREGKHDRVLASRPARGQQLGWTAAGGMRGEPPGRLVAQPPERQDVPIGVDDSDSVRPHQAQPPVRRALRQRWPVRTE